MNKPEVVITHHALSLPHHTVNHVNEWHKARWSNFVSELGYHVGYHYVIESNGKVTQTRLHHEVGAHCLGMNKSSIGVCFMGNFDRGYPTKAQEQAWIELYRKIRREYPNIPTKPHRAFANRTCHGTNLTDNHFAVLKQVWTLQLEVKRLLVKLLNLIS